LFCSYLFFLGFVFFFTLIYMYGRFPPKTDKSQGGRYPKRDKQNIKRSRTKSSWRRERKDSRGKRNLIRGITRITHPDNRISRLNDLMNKVRENGELTRQNPMFQKEIIHNQLPINQSQQQSNLNASEHLIQFSPETFEYHFPQIDSAQPEPPASSQSVFMPHLSPITRLLPQFNSQLIWSSLISALNPMKTVHSNGTIAEPSQQNSELVQLEPSSHQSIAPTIVHLPPFQPSTMLQFQTQLVQLPVHATTGS